MRCTRSTDGSSSPQSAWPASWKATTRFSWSLSTRRDCTPAITRSIAASKSTAPIAPARRREDRGLVADVREVGAGQPARLLRDEREVDVAERLVARVHVKHAFAPAHVGRRDEHLTVEAAGAKQRRVELLEQVRRADH